MSAPLEVVPLGGVGEFGRNVLWLRSEGSSVLVDVGVSFPDETFPGIERIAPDLSFLRAERIEGVFLTHGHEDHIGALALLREWCDAPVYGLPFTLALALPRVTLVDPERRVMALSGVAPSTLPDTDRVTTVRPIAGGTYKWFLLPGTQVPVTGRQDGAWRVAPAR